MALDLVPIESKKSKLDLVPMESLPKDVRSYDIDSPSKVVGDAVMTGAAVAGGAYLGGKAIAKGADLFAHTIANLSRPTLDTLQDQGFQRIKDVGQDPDMYLTQKAIPQAKRTVLSSIMNFKGDTGILDELGIKPDEIEDFLRLPPGKLRILGSQVSADWSETVRNLRKSRQEIGNQIGDYWEEARKFGYEAMPRKSYAMIRSELKKYGLVDERGRLYSNYKDIVPTKGIAKLADVYVEMGPGIKGTTKIDIPKYKNWIARLEGATGTDEQYNVSLHKATKFLRGEVSNDIDQTLGIFRDRKPLTELNRDYYESILMEDLGDKINKVVNEAPEKIRTSPNPVLKEKYAKMYGPQFIKDVDAIEAAKNLYPKRSGGLTQFAARSVVKGVLEVGNAIAPAINKIKKIVNTVAKASRLPMVALSAVNGVDQANIMRDIQAGKIKEIGIGMFGNLIRVDKDQVQKLKKLGLTYNTDSELPAGSTFTDEEPSKQVTPSDTNPEPYVTPASPQVPEDMVTPANPDVPQDMITPARPQIAEPLVSPISEDAVKSESIAKESSKELQARMIEARKIHGGTSTEYQDAKTAYEKAKQDEIKGSSNKMSVGEGVSQQEASELFSKYKDDINTLRGASLWNQKDKLGDYTKRGGSEDWNKLSSKQQSIRSKAFEKAMNQTLSDSPAAQRLKNAGFRIEFKSGEDDFTISIPSSKKR